MHTTIRNTLIDNMKCISILYIVFIWHFSNYALGLQPVVSNNVAYQITIGILACFTLLSGFLASDSCVSQHIDILRFYKRRLLRLYPLFFFSCILFYVFKLCTFRQLILSVLFIGPLAGDMPITLWYIDMLFIYIFFTPLLIYFSSGRMRTLIGVSVWGILWGICCFTYDARCWFYWPFYCISFILRRYNTVKKYFNIIFLVCLIFWSIVIIDNKITDEMTLMSYPLSLGVIGIVFVIGKLIDKFQMIREVAFFISIASIIMYLYHRIVFKVIVYLYGGNMPLSFGYVFVMPFFIYLSYKVQKKYINIFTTDSINKLN